MQDNNLIWSTVISPRSMMEIKTPLMDRFQGFLEAEIGEQSASKIIKASYAFQARMDEGTREDQMTEMEHDLARILYPALGIYRGLLKAGFSEARCRDIITRMVDDAKPEIMNRPWADPLC